MLLQVRETQLCRVLYEQPGLLRALGRQIIILI